MKGRIPYGMHNQGERARGLAERGTGGENYLASDPSCRVQSCMATGTESLDGRVA